MAHCKVEHVLRQPTPKAEYTCRPKTSKEVPYTLLTTSPKIQPGLMSHKTTTVTMSLLYYPKTLDILESEK